MPKFTSAERILVKSIVANLSIKRITESEIINEVYNQTNKTLTHAGLFYVKEAIKRESFKWYKTMREGEYEYLHEFKERINEIMNLQKKCHAILDNPLNQNNAQVQLSAIAELHKLTITLSNLYDVAPTIIGYKHVQIPPKRQRNNQVYSRRFDNKATYQVRNLE